MNDSANSQDLKKQLLGSLLGPGGAEVSCEQCFDLLDRFVDLEAAGHDPAAAIPGMREHLAGCPACAEDHASLLALVRSNSDSR